MTVRTCTTVRVSAIVAAVFLLNCSTTVWRARFIKPKEYVRIDPDVSFLKCHTVTGHVYVLSSWKFEKEKEQITGAGIHYDEDRNVVTRGMLTIAYPEIALLETNQPESVTNNGHFVVMGIFTVAAVVGAVICIVNPKACFGSCPTFYAFDGNKLALQAEGFSSSVARVLEETDIDALYTAKPTSRRFELLVANDALETHMIRSVRILAAPRPPDGRVFRDRESYYPTRKLHQAVSCVSDQGDCLKQVQAVDQSEYLSPADGTDLAARETIELTFRGGKGTLGLVIAARNSLLNTFLFYQTLAYMGMSAGDWIMQLERGGSRAAAMLRDAGRLLNKVSITVLSKEGTWVPAGSFDEVGPIAREVQVLRLPDNLPGEEIRVRLSLTRGNWKLDYLALAELEAPVVPVPVTVARVERNGSGAPEAYQKLHDRDAYLIMYPQEAYTLVFNLPEGSHELFLESRGYYYEWIRKQWLPEEDAAEVARILLEPSEAFKRLAPMYKEIEGSMEKVFWQSRFGR